MWCRWRLAACLSISCLYIKTGERICCGLKPDYKDTGDFTLAVYRFGPLFEETDKPVVVLMHGWPELAYSWRHQADHLGRLGYPVLVPDMPGYGQSDKPDDVTLYTMERLNAAMGGLLDAYGIEKAVFIGHDWGAMLMWGMPFNQTDRMLGGATLNVAMMNLRVDPVALFRNMLGDDMYIVQCQTEGVAEPVYEADMAKTFRFFMRKPSSPQQMKKTGIDPKQGLSFLKLLQLDEKYWGGEPLCSDEDLQVYIDAYTKGGFKAPLHWYRNMTLNWQESEKIKTDGKLPMIHMPWLMVTADRDIACPAEQANGMEHMITDYTRHDLKECGHWSMLEKTDEVNEVLATWLQAKFG